MKKLQLVLLAWLMSLTSVVHASEGTFDRTAEVDKYIALMGTSTTDTLAVVAKEITVAGLSDPRLAAALNERLLNDYKTLSTDRVADTYGVWMARALASFGIADYASTLQTVAHGTRNGKVASACKEALSTIAWNQAKNQVMASTQYYTEGDDPAVSRLMNLLMSDDYSYKHYAAERMNWERILDKRLMAAIAPQVQQYVDRKDTHLTDLQDDTIASFVKLLGYSKDVQYRGVLENVLAYKQASSGVKRHAKYAIARLF